jgi:demethylmenaquinone methyltransferase/2-methoxy-6-polyprenyl-1,4-benzoquinol methylase
LPFEKSGIDKILVSFTLELFDTPEIPVVLAECTRALNKDGLISAVALSKKTQT